MYAGHLGYDVIVREITYSTACRIFLAENIKAFPIFQRRRIIGVRLIKIDETLSVGKFFMLERLYGCTKIREP